MVAPTLLNPQIEQGMRTIECLDAGGFDIPAAFWRFDDEETTWRFTIAEASVQAQGPRAVYHRMGARLEAEKNVIPIQEIYLISTADPMLSLIRTLTRTAPKAIEALFVRSNVVERTVTPDMYVYRMAMQSAAPTAP